MLQQLRAVRAFIDENAAKLNGVVNTGARQKVDDAITQLSTHVSDQTGHYLAAQGATQRKAPFGPRSCATIWRRSPHRSRRGPGVAGDRAAQDAERQTSHGRCKQSWCRSPEARRVVTGTESQI
jgi:hypothetical protein